MAPFAINDASVIPVFVTRPALVTGCAPAALFVLSALIVPLKTFAASLLSVSDSIGEIQLPGSLAAGLTPVAHPTKKIILKSTGKTNAKDTFLKTLFIIFSS
jgi:hypothetical protein